MSVRKDVTRWNRAGLNRFDYVDGNAATYLEILRTAMAHTKRFPQWQRLISDPPSDIDSQASAQQRETDLLFRQQQMLDQYHADPSEIGWEVLRELARSAHILSTYINSYANEGFLTTATQWDNIRKLVKTIDYYPAPAASASVYLVFDAKADSKGLVESGVQVKYSPPEGGEALVFETLEDFEIDVTMNAMRVKNWNRNGNSFAATFTDNNIKFSCGDAAVSSGQIALLLKDGTEAGTAVICELDEIKAVSGLLSIKNKDAHSDWSGWIAGDARLLTGAKEIRRARLNGENVLHFAQPHGLAVGDVVAWSENKLWHYAEVSESDETAIRCTTSPAKESTLYRAYTIQADENGEILFPLKCLSVSKSKRGPAKEPGKPEERSDDDELYAYKVKEVGIAEIYLVNGAENLVGKILDKEQEFSFDGGTQGLLSGNWVAVEDEDGIFKAVKISQLIETESSIKLTFNDSPASIRRLFGPFEHVLHAQGYDFNTEPLDAKLTLQLQADEGKPEGLEKGRRVFLEQQIDGVRSNGFLTQISSLYQSNDTVEIELDPFPDPSLGFCKGNAVLRANVALAGHGESKPVKVLGSGDATQTRQSMVLEVEGLAFQADAAMSSGVAAATELSVDGRIWQQVSNLNDSGPADAHYVVRMTEDGYPRFVFGDGKHGRRLPTGNNNVRLGYRVGSGLAGNVKAGSLEKLGKPHRLIESASQPLDAYGGNSMEDVTQMRELAPARTLTLDRAVSLSDFEYLAAGNSSVWQARAFQSISDRGRRDYIEVVLVPAGGGKLGALALTLRNFLQSHAIPQVHVTVLDYKPVYLNLAVKVRVKTAEYELDSVVKQVKSALLQQFSLSKRKLGQPVFLSEIYALVESVQGVENSRCILAGNPRLKFIPASERAVIYINDSSLPLQVAGEDYWL